MTMASLVSLKLHNSRVIVYNHHMFIVQAAGKEGDLRYTIKIFVYFDKAVVSPWTSKSMGEPH